jgi:hypothetical protein
MAEKIPANGTWEGGTEFPGRRPVPGDEQYARKQNEQLGDNEFGIAVAPYLDPEDRGLIKPEQAKLVGLTRPATTSAVNLVGRKTPYKRKVPVSMHPEGKSELELPPGKIYAMHGEDANPRTFAHEYRHGSEKIDGRPNEETYNRYEDMHHALTGDDKEDAQYYLRDLMIDRVMKNRDLEIFDSIRTVDDLDEVMEKIAPALQQQVQNWHDDGREGSIDQHLSSLVSEYLTTEANGPPDEIPKEGLKDNSE